MNDRTGLFLPSARATASTRPRSRWRPTRRSRKILDSRFQDRSATRGTPWREPHEARRRGANRALRGIPQDLAVPDHDDLNESGTEREGASPGAVDTAYTSNRGCCLGLYCALAGKSLSTMADGEQAAAGRGHRNASRTRETPLPRERPPRRGATMSGRRPGNQARPGAACPGPPAARAPLP